MVFYELVILIVKDKPLNFLRELPSSATSLTNKVISLNSPGIFTLKKKSQVGCFS